MPNAFPPTPDAALARIDSIDPAAYARTRNALDGAVTRLSPYVTHGFVDLPEVIARLRERCTVPPRDRLVMEFGWREFFQHVWRYRGEGIFSDLRPPVTSLAYADRLPDDLRSASTGVPVIDHAVRQLYASGYLHNHARMWLASYLVHLRKVHWRAGADWLYGHLLDGDLASNHLSWQWVAGTFSAKPYLFNAENVARFAPADWHSPGTAIDTSYECLDVMARGEPDCGPESLRPAPSDEPALHGPLDFGAWELPVMPDPSIPVRLVHPWNLGPEVAGEWRLAVLHRPFHERFPWSPGRWRFVNDRLREVCQATFTGDLNELLPVLAGRPVLARTTLNPGYAGFLRAANVQLEPVSGFLPDPGRECASFSKFWDLTHGS